MACPTTTGRAFFSSVLLCFLFSFPCFSTSDAFGDGQREFDYFILSLQWPGTICQRTHHCCPSNGCCGSSLTPTEFTIHGLWPDYNDGSWPACCSGSDFDMGKIMSLLGVLQKYWPSLSCSSSSDCHGGRGIFWEHEWEKHGTCSYPVIQDEYNYFSTALDLYFKYNIMKMLNDAGYMPKNGYKYPLGGIVSAIKDAFGTTPLLVCKYGAVKELRICFYKDFKPRDCINGYYSQVDKLSSRSSCPKYISLPEYTPIRLGDGHAAIPWLPDTEIL